MRRSTHFNLHGLCFYTTALDADIWYSLVTITLDADFLRIQGLCKVKCPERGGLPVLSRAVEMSHLDDVSTPVPRFAGRMIFGDGTSPCKHGAQQGPARK